MDNEITFEQAMNRLQEITTILNENTCSLDEGFKLYQEGIQLTKYCQDKISFYANKLEEIKEEK